jgi:splicing factor, arginine/serine-rich 1
MSATIFVGNLPRDVKDREVDDLFYKYGKITDIHVKSSPKDTFAFVTFRDPRDAKDAVLGRDGYRFAGGKLHVEPAKRETEDRKRPERDDRKRDDRDDRRRDDRRSEYRRDEPKRERTVSDKYFKLNVTGLPEAASWQDLKDHIRSIMQVSAFVSVENGEGLIGFEKEEDRDAALKQLDDTNMKSHKGETSFIRTKVYEDPKMDEVKEVRRSRSRSRSQTRN